MDFLGYDLQMKETPEFVNRKNPLRTKVFSNWETKLRPQTTTSINKDQARNLRSRSVATHRIKECVCESPCTGFYCVTARRNLVLYMTPLTTSSLPSLPIRME